MKDGSFSFPSFGRSSLGSWFCFVIDRTFPLFLPTSQASWLWLQTWVPVRVSLPPSGGWIPGPSNLFAKNFLFSRQWSSFTWGPPPGSPVLFLLVRLHRLFYQDALDPFFGLNVFPSILPSLLRDSCSSFQENCSVQGSNASDCSFKFEQYMDFDPYPSRRIIFLFQFVRQEIVIKQTEELLPLSLSHILPR